ncbi:hypothetical protein AeMF1_009791 [Aphanomyces euteiches]|nr:hypothetical protein AeMF1_009791 [Aphanomyces euteiches]KAH9195142.1 hypothetical protein AeNC1_002880 [Aphanomyces euteiches]
MLVMPSWPAFNSPRVDKEKQLDTTALCTGNGDCCKVLVTAVVAGHVEAITRLVTQHGCDVNRVSMCRPGEPCVSPGCARRTKFPSDIETLRSFQSLPSEAQPTCGYTLLQLAIQAGKISSVDALIAAGANPSLHPDTSPSCLSMALVQGDEMALRILKHVSTVEDDAVVAVATLGSLPLYTAMSCRLTSAQRVKAIATAANHQHLHLVQTLLDTGDDVVIQNGLHAMVQQGCLALVRHVVKSYGTSVILYCEPNKLGDSLLHTACRANQPELVKYLIRCGVDVNAPNAIGVSALYMCSAVGSELAVRMLLKAGAQIHGAAGPHGDTALHIAVQENHLQIVRYLIHNGAPLEAANSLGHTPLHVASLQGHGTIVAYLLRKGANIHAKTAHDETPLVKAYQMHHRRVIEMLLAHGALPGKDATVTSNHRP